MSERTQRQDERSAMRRLAFQSLFQLDATGGDAEGVVAGMDGSEFAETLTPAEVREALELAILAYEARAGADAELTELAPTWPASRQPAVDRAVLRLGHYELTQRRASAATIIDEAVELAKAFGTEKSPAFVNALLDKVARRIDPTLPPVAEG